MDPLVTLGILAIYVTIALTGYFAGVRAEVWQLRKARQAFHDRYVDKVTQLRGKAEFALLTTIYDESPKLKEIFHRTSPTTTPSQPLTDSDRKSVQEEISRITQGLQSVTEPKLLFDQVCADYDGQEESLGSLVNALIGMSFLVPLDVLGLTLAPTVDPALWGLLTLIILLVGVPQAWNRSQTYRTSRDRRKVNERRLIASVDEKIFAPIPPYEDVPPPNPPAETAVAFAPHTIDATNTGDQNHAGQRTRTGNSQ